MSPRTNSNSECILVPSDIRSFKELGKYPYFIRSSEKETLFSHYFRYGNFEKDLLLVPTALSNISIPTDSPIFQNSGFYRNCVNQVHIILADKKPNTAPAVMGFHPIIFKESAEELDDIWSALILISQNAKVSQNQVDTELVKISLDDLDLSSIETKFLDDSSKKVGGIQKYFTKSTTHMMKVIRGLRGLYERIFVLVDPITLHFLLMKNPGVFNCFLNNFKIIEEGFIQAHILEAFGNMTKSFEEVNTSA